MDNDAPVVIWLDDLRDPVVWADWIEARGMALDRVRWAKDYDAFCAMFLEALGSGGIAAVCFDNDLGDLRPGKEGRHAFTWMEEMVHTRDIPPFELHSQTANPAARREIEAGFRALRRFWALTSG